MDLPDLKTPRVLQLVLALNPGGTERLVVELVRRLGDEIPMAVCCLDDEGLWASTLRDQGIEVTALRRGAGFRPWVGRAVAAAAKRHRASIVHCHHYSPFVYGCVSRLWNPGSHIIFTEHGRLSDARPSRKRRVANGVLAQLPLAVFAVSNDLKRHIVGEGFRESDVHVIHNGIEIGSLPEPEARRRARRRLGVEDETLVIGTVARLDPVKDLGTLIRAVARLGPNIPHALAVIGDGPERRALNELAATVGVGHQVRLVGHRDDARDWLAGCDVYVNSSISEGVSLTILEAMAAGLPIVATRVGGTPEVITRDCGFLVPPRDPEAIAQVLRELAGNKLRRCELGRSARTRVERHFTIDRMVADYRDVYRRAA